MRENLRSSARAIVEMSNVFASPGTPTSRQLPPAKSAISACSTTSSCPTITLRSSCLMRPLAACRRSASAASSRCSMAVPSGAADAVTSLSVEGARPSAAQRVHDVVDAQLERFVRQIDRIEPDVRVLPILRQVLVVVHDHHEALRRVVVLEDPVVLRRSAVDGIVLLERRDAVERVEDRMRHVEPHEAMLWQHAPHLRLEVEPVLPLEVVEDEEAALHQVVAQALHLRLAWLPEARL